MEKDIFYRNAFDFEVKRISMLDSTISIPFCSPPCQGIEGTRLGGNFLSEISPIFTRSRPEIRMGFTIIILKEILLRSDTFEELMSLSSRYKSGKWSCLFLRLKIFYSIWRATEIFARLPCPVKFKGMPCWWVFFFSWNVILASICVWLR